MGPWSKADLERWASEHGGIVRSDGPDANGTVTHHTADGTYVTMVGDLPRMIGHAAPQAGAQAQADPAAAVTAAGGPVMLKHRITGETRIMTRAAWEREKQNGSLWFGPTAQWEEVSQAPPAQPAPPARQQAAPSSGGNMDQAALEARIAELQKQYPGLKFMGQSIKDKQRTRYDTDSDKNVTETVRVPVVQWIDPKTGYTLTAEVEPGGGRYTVVDDRLIDANKDEAGKDPDDPDARNKAELQRQRERNAALPADQDPAYETDAERRQRAEARIKQQGEDARRADADRRAEADRNKPSVTIKEDGSGGFVSISTYPDGRVETKPVPGIKGTPAQIKEGGVTYERQPDGTYKPAAGIPNPNTPEPEGAPQPSFTVGDAAADLQKYQQWLNSEMRKPGATLTAARADQLLEARRKLWDTALSEQAGIVNAQQQAYRDQLTQRGQTLNDQQTRRSSATSIANQAQSSYGDLMDKMGANPGGASIAKAIQEARFNAAAFVDGLSGGGVPEIKMGPAYEQTNQMQLNPRAGSPVPTIPQPGAPTPTANALGVGAVGNVPAPTGAPAPAQPPPVFRPAPVAPAPVQAAPPVNQQARDTDYRTAPAPVSDPRDAGGYSGPPPMVPAFSPAPSDPFVGGRVLPQSEPTPVVVPPSEAPAPWQPAPAPQPSGGAFPPIPAIPRAGTEAGGNVQMAPTQPAPWFLAGSSNGRAYDPTPAISSLVADPNIDNEMLRQAVALEYPGFNFDALVGGRATG